MNHQIAEQLKRRRQPISPKGKVLDRIATGCSFAFVIFIAFSLVEAALFRRAEVDWTLILPVVIILSLFVPVRLVIEKRVHRASRRQYLRKSRERDKRVEYNTPLREEAHKANRPYHYDDDGTLHVG